MVFFFIANGKSASYRESKIFAFFFFLLCTSFSHAKMETTDRGCSSSSMMVCSYHVEKNTKCEFTKTTIMNEWFWQKEPRFILKFDTKYWYTCVLLYLIFQALLLALPLRKNHHRKIIVYLVIRTEHYFKIFFGQKKKLQ